MQISFFTQYNQNKYNIPTTNHNPQIGFKGKIVVTKEQLEPLVQQGLSIPEIAEKIGGVSRFICVKFLQQFNLTTQSQISRQAASKIPIEKFKASIAEGKLRSEILKEFNITIGIYNRMCQKLGIETAKTKQKKFIDSITKETFLELLNSGKTVPEIRKELNNISMETYVLLLKKFGIKTQYKKYIENSAKITKTQLEELLKSGKSSVEMYNELNVAQATFTRHLNINGLETTYLQNKRNSENITKEQFLEVYNRKKTVKEIQEELKISSSTYKKLLNKFEIVTKFKENRNKTAQITKEKLQAMVDSGLEPKKIAAELNISNKTFYTLLKYHKINYNYKHHLKEIVIPKEKLEELSKSGKTIEEISEILGVYASTYANKAKIAGVDTKLRKSIDKIQSISKTEFQEQIDKGFSVSEICENLDITPAMYVKLLDKHNAKTLSKDLHNKVSQITKEQILELKSQGKTLKEICNELNISLTSYYKILKYKQPLN